MTTYISSNFTIDEFTHSQTAARLGIDNDPPPDVLDNLKSLAYALEEVRSILGNRPLLISSGYRSPALNAAVGGSIGSQHLLGEAVDFTCPSFGTPDEIVKALQASGTPYHQLIREFGRWVHISFKFGIPLAELKRQTLIIDSTGTRVYA
jgi:zinc D-Ala-D-Ala carboxypeptidase